MSTVAELAKRSALAVRQATERRRAATELANRQLREERANLTLKCSPLERWFPDASWTVIAYARRGCAADLEGYNGAECVVTDAYQSVKLLLQPRVIGEVPPQYPPDVYLVELRQDTESGYDYYDGPRVRSVEELGEALLRREKTA